MKWYEASCFGTNFNSRTTGADEDLTAGFVPIDFEK
jgi:hypothetical protein